MEEGRGIVFKGNAEGLIIVIPEGLTPEQIMSETGAKVSAAARFFKGARIKVAYRGPQLSEEDEARLRAILDEKSGAIIENFSREDDSAQPPKSDAPAAPASAFRRYFANNANEDSCKFVRSTVRSGTRVEFDGSVVVIGDVNPGAEIIASGNVLVLGTLRGMVHAGAGGNKDAFVYAHSLKPTQIRIAEVIARGPDDSSDSVLSPEIATVKDGVIIVDPA